jgi:hypothetical protein
MFMCEGCGAAITATIAALILARVAYRKPLPDAVIVAVGLPVTALVHWVVGP